MNEVSLTSLNRFPPLQSITKRSAYLLLAITYFILPISSSIKSVTLTAFLILALLTPAYRVAALRVLQTPWAKAVCLFVGLILFDCLWGPASMRDKWVSVEKYSKLLYLPFLVVMFRQVTIRDMAIKITLAGISFVSLLSILAYFQFLPLEAEKVFRNHIVFGFMGAYGAYVAACLACVRLQLPVKRRIGQKRMIPGRHALSKLQIITWSPKTMRYGLSRSRHTQATLPTKFKLIARWGYALIAFLLSFKVLWINGGRMAYVIMAALTMLWAWQFFSKMQMLVACLFLCGGLCTAYEFSSTMHNRIDLTRQEFASYKDPNAVTSMGLRVQMHRFARAMLIKHPILGNGTGSFKALTDKELKLSGFEAGLRDPHSQYWLIASEQGLLGLLAFFVMFGCFFMTTYRLKQTGLLAVGLLVAFALSQLTDSMLFYSGPGCFFMMIMAIYLGEAHENSV